jgi:hypothetical protein
MVQQSGAWRSASKQPVPQQQTAKDGAWHVAQKATQSPKQVQSKPLSNHARYIQRQKRICSTRSKRAAGTQAQKAVKKAEWIAGCSKTQNPSDNDQQNHF